MLAFPTMRRQSCWNGGNLLARILKITGIAGFVGLLAAVVVVGGQQASRLSSATGLAARQLCSLHYASGMDADFVRETWIDPHIKPVADFVRLTKDDENRTTEASIFGLFKTKAKYRSRGHGCVLDFGEEIVELTPRPQLPRREYALWAALEEAGVDPGGWNSQFFDQEKLDKAIEEAFKEPTDQENRQTVSIVDLHKGQIVAEKVRGGLTINTPLPGYSMAKSMTVTMIGLLVQNEGLDVFSVIPNAEALTEAGVTYDNLLRMVSGINVLEDGSGLDANSIMLTQKNDAATYAIERGLMAAPGEEYAYTGGGPIVLAKAFNSMVAPTDPNGAYAYLQDKLIEPLDLSTLILESDGMGTFLGSTYMSASAYDWAKLGQLYLQNGVWNGERILPESWSRYVSTPTPQSGDRYYGAGFWSGAGGGRTDPEHPHPALPKDAYFMHGMMNQSIYIIPSKDLVIIRLGATRSYHESGEQELVRDVVAAMKE